MTITPIANSVSWLSIGAPGSDGQFRPRLDGGLSPSGVAILEGDLDCQQLFVPDHVIPFHCRQLPGIVGA